MPKTVNETSKLVDIPLYDDGYSPALFTAQPADYKHPLKPNKKKSPLIGSNEPNDSSEQQSGLCCVIL